MANYSYIGYAPGVITVDFNFGPDFITLDASYDPSTDRRIFDVTDDAGGLILNGGAGLPDTGTVFNGDRFNNENGDDLTQTGVVTNLDGSTTFASGNIYLEESYSLTNPSGGTIDVFRVEVDGTLVGYITSEPLVPGTTYTFQVSNVTPTNAPDTTDPTAIVDVPCFVEGTMIQTPCGEKAIETLAEGDEVVTLDNGPRRIRWVGCKQLGSVELATKPRLRPILIKAGALGCGLPRRDLRVSPQHRMLVRSAIAIRMFDTEEVLVPAHKLVGVPGVSVDDGCDQVTYYHMLFDRHEIVFAEQAPSESLFTGPEALKGISPAARNEILELFPSLATPDHIPESARPIPVKGHKIRSMIQRHIKNSRSLIEHI